LLALQNPLPWFAFKVASSFSETMPELNATRPLWETPIDLDNARLVQFLGKEPHTPLDSAIETTLPGLTSLWTNSGLPCMAWLRFTWIVLPHSILDAHKTVLPEF